MTYESNDSTTVGPIPVFLYRKFTTMIVPNDVVVYVYNNIVNSQTGAGRGGHRLESTHVYPALAKRLYVKGVI
ncbi:MAG: hypothetical protein K6T68_04105, partial [Alicyclobacillus shizuokensis]|nr:hypothetical protein [Alicyclobacillus shizuokensis]